MIFIIIGFIGCAAMIFVLGLWCGWYFTRQQYEQYIETAEQKIRTAEYTFEQAVQREKDFYTTQKSERLRKYMAWERERASLPIGVPKDFQS